MKMDNANGHTINLANSIIGVSILAMPYCFRQCGILLSIFLLLISSIISRLTCHFLLKSAILARRKTFEFLAFHIFGPLGKFLIEIGMIGFLLGTCIAFFVVMGDLGPAILSEMTAVPIASTVRTFTLVALAVFCVLPLGLLRNVDSLNGVSTATIGFYCCLVIKVVVEALPHIFTADWVNDVNLWQPAGILQCLPIFSMALFCQTQLFEIYQAIPNASLEKMNGMIRVAVNMCTWVYIFVGAFGYIAFFQKPFTGNVLLTFSPSVSSDIMKIGFVLSLAFSFPLVIFPCRASLFSLLYKGTSYVNLHEGGNPHFIPEGKFKMLTFVIVLVSLTIGIMIPNIELVLGLIGSTIGVMICVIFPVTCFICISPKNTNERILAQIMLFVGVIVMVLGTYANLQAVQAAEIVVVQEKIPPLSELKPKLPELEKPVVVDIPTTIKITEEKKQKPPDVKTVNLVEPAMKKEDPKEVRHEPPQPEEPVENLVVKTEKNEAPETQKPQTEEKKEIVNPVVDSQPLKEEPKKEKNEEVDIEAIKKEEKELKEEEDKKEKKEKEQQQILIEIQKQNEVNKEMVEQQKKLIEAIKQQQEDKKEVDKVKEEKVKAVKEIEDIARKAIESISGTEDKNKKKEETVAQEISKVVANFEETKKQIEVKEIIDVKKDKNVEAKIGNESKIPSSKISNIEKQETEIKKEPEIKNTSAKIQMEPLPLALAKLKSGSNETKKDENVDVNKAMRRDILSNEESTKSRPKRETDDGKMENLSKAVKEVCDEVAKSTITETEKPIITMLCKLSEPNVETSNFNTLEERTDLGVSRVKQGTG